MKKAAILFTWGILLFGALVLIFSVTGCRTVKRSDVSAISMTKIVHDTIKVATKASDSFFHERIVHDTVVGVSGNEISFIMDTVHDTVIRKGNVRLSVRGKVIDCSADSLTVVVTRLVKDSTNQSRSNDSLYTENQQQYYALQDYKFKSEVRGEPWWRVWLNYLIAAVIGVLVWECFKLIRKHIML